jgi:predicted aconitase with swiveling domain
MAQLTIQGKPFIPGSANGIALVSHEPLSFWGGYDW